MTPSRWTAAQLQRCVVEDVDGQRLGLVRDARLVPGDRGLEVTGLVVGRRLLSERFGTSRGVVTGPRLLTAWLARRSSSLRWVPWSQIAELRDGHVRLHVPAASLIPLSEVAR